MLANLEETHRREAQDIRGKISAVQTKVEAVEATSSAAEARLLAPEESQARQDSQLLMMQLHMEDMEDRGHRNNLCLCGIPKADGVENVAEVVQSVFQQLMATDDMVILDRAQRAMGLKSGFRDILCRLHYYSDKEALAQKAWDRGSFRYRESEVFVMPDLSHATLQRRVVLKPLREAI